MKFLNKIIRKNFSHQNVQGVEKWQKVMNSKATTPEGKAQVGQLNSLLNFYNNKNPDSVPDIDWEKWESLI